MAAVAQLRSSTVIAAGQIATTIVGFALGVVMTLIFVFDRSQPDASPPHAIVPAPHRQMPAPVADSRPLPLPAPVAAPATPDIAPTDDDDTAVDATPLPPRVARPVAVGRMVFVVQAGAFLNRAIAERLVQRLSAAGVAASISVHTDSAGRPWNFVRLTQIYRDRGAAQSASRALGHDAGVSALVVRVPAVSP